MRPMDKENILIIQQGGGKNLLPPLLCLCRFPVSVTDNGNIPVLFDSLLDVRVVIDVVLTIAVIAVALGAIPELQLRV